jgi:hypothetical protein
MLMPIFRTLSAAAPVARTPTAAVAANPLSTVLRSIMVPPLNFYFL